MSSPYIVNGIALSASSIKNKTTYVNLFCISLALLSLNVNIFLLKSWQVSAALLSAEKDNKFNVAWICP